MSAWGWMIISGTSFLAGALFAGLVALVLAASQAASPGMRRAWAWLVARVR